MAWSAVVAITAIAVACLLAGQPAFARSALQPPDPGPDVQTSFGPVEPSQKYVGAIEELSDIDVFHLQLASAPASIGVQVTHTNEVCEIWAVLVDRQDTQSQEVVAPRGGTARLQAIAPVHGPYYVSVSTGPLRECAGAGYELEFFVEPLPLPALAGGDPAKRRAAALTVGRELLCLAVCARAAKVGKRRRALIERFHQTRGATHRRVGRRLRRVTERYRKIIRRQNKVCGSS
jgi:hypothetical protein